MDILEPKYYFKLHETYLNQYTKESVYGVKEYPNKPRNLIIFDNRLIHCIANWSGHNTGLSLRFITVE